MIYFTSYQPWDSQKTLIQDIKLTNLLDEARNDIYNPILSPKP